MVGPCTFSDDLWVCNYLLYLLHELVRLFEFLIENTKLEQSSHNDVEEQTGTSPSTHDASGPPHDVLYYVPDYSAPMQDGITSVNMNTRLCALL